jgi:hypothetical protein
MNNTKRWFSIAIGSGLAVLLLVGVLTAVPAFAQGPGGMMGGGMMGGPGYNGGMPSGYGPGGMMGYTGTTNGYGPGGMMSGTMGGMMGGGMMWSSNSPFFAIEPLTLAEATATLDTYLAALDGSNLVLGEVMVFDNHAYAQIVEKESGIGVTEVLVDPTTKAVYPEMGPNMMWNLKYGMMSGFGGYGMGMMRGGFGFNNVAPADVSAEMPVTPEQAVEAAQTYLDTVFSAANLTADEHADPFYGYYTLHVNRDGETVGMLSVNGYTGQVFPHTWHGELLEMSGE